MASDGGSDPEALQDPRQARGGWNGRGVPGRGYDPGPEVLFRIMPFELAQSLALPSAMIRPTEYRSSVGSFRVTFPECSRLACGTVGWPVDTLGDSPIR
jgi:hypothetical protein